MFDIYQGVQPFARCLPVGGGFGCVGRGGVESKLGALGVFRETKTKTKKLKKTADWGKVEWPQVLGRRIRRGGAQPALQGAENSHRQRETESGILGCITV